MKAGGGGSGGVCDDVLESRPVAQGYRPSSSRVIHSFLFIYFCCWSGGD